jgi:hypothetical protein
MPRDTNRVKKKDETPNLSAPIDAPSLTSYLASKFTKLVESKKLVPSFNEQEAELLRELHSLGIETLGQLDTQIPADYSARARRVHETDTFLGLVRSIFLIIDAEAYFAKAWNEFSWNAISPESLRLLQFYNPDIENVLRKYRITVQSHIII